LANTSIGVEVSSAIAIGASSEPSLLAVGTSSSKVIVSVPSTASLSSLSIAVKVRTALASFSVSVPSSACRTLVSSVTVYWPEVGFTATVNRSVPVRLPLLIVAVSVLEPASQL